MNWIDKYLLNRSWRFKSRCRTFESFHLSTRPWPDNHSQTPWSLRCRRDTQTSGWPRRSQEGEFLDHPSQTVILFQVHHRGKWRRCSGSYPEKWLRRISLASVYRPGFDITIPQHHWGGAAKKDIGPHMWWKTEERWNKTRCSWSKINVLFWDVKGPLSELQLRRLNSRLPRQWTVEIVWSGWFALKHPSIIGSNGKTTWLFRDIVNHATHDGHPTAKLFAVKITRHLHL